LRLNQFKEKVFFHLHDIYTQRECEKIFFLLLEEIEFIPKHEAILNSNKTLTKSQKLNWALNELKEGKPWQYTLGYSWFFGLKFLLNHDVLIPRPETEELVQLVLDKIKIKHKTTVLDVGTGSGCIAVALAKKRANANIFAVDVSKKAIEIAIQNALMNGVKVSFLLFDILKEETWSVLPENIHTIVSNPPYIDDEAEIDEMVLKNEPHLALLAPKKDPFIFYRKILQLAVMKKSVRNIFFEINENHADSLGKQKFLSGFETSFSHDMQGKNRFLYVKLS